MAPKACVCLPRGHVRKILGCISKLHHKKKENVEFFQDIFSMRTVNFLNIRTPQKFVVITLKFELCGSTIE